MHKQTYKQTLGRLIENETHLTVFRPRLSTNQDSVWYRDAKEDGWDAVERIEREREREREKGRV